jgi:hypothetical protein
MVLVEAAVLVVDDLEEVKEEVAAFDLCCRKFVAILLKFIKQCTVSLVFLWYKLLILSCSAGGKK